MALNKEGLIELENHFIQASKALRCAWRVLKDNEFDEAAKETADTILDTEASATLIRDKITELYA